MRKFAAFAATFALLVAGVTAQPVSSKLFGGLRWRLIGPFRGGRALAVTGVPGSPEKFYFGAVGGGVWESDNAGRTWTPIFDRQPTASIGSIAVAPSDPKVIYVGSGEADMRGDIQQGNGMYKSSDAGKTWSHIGLNDTRQIGKIVVDPEDPNRLFVAALGHQYGPNEQRGVFRSLDGGATWTKVLYKGPNVGAIDLSMDPGDSNVIYASLWSTRRPPWSVYPPSNGPGSGMFKTSDGGETWSEIVGHGFPAFVGRVGIAVSPANNRRVYAFVDTNEIKTGGVYRSDDKGATWRHTDGESRIWTRGWYFAGITADPKNPDVVYVMNTSTYQSEDGGATFTPIKGAPGGDDYHTLWIEPDDPTRMILGCDQGVVVSVDGAKSWSSWYNQPTAQLYHIIADDRFPYWVYGAQQDSGVIAVPSQSMRTAISPIDWRPIDVGGESGTIAVDRLHPGVLLSSSGSKEDLSTGWEKSIDPTVARPGRIWRSEWTSPIAASPIDPKVFYVGRQSIFRTADSGATWQLISPDLTRTTTTVPSNLDPVTAADNDGQPRRAVVYWIAPSPVKARRIWASTDDGLIWLTDDEGRHWSNRTPSMLNPWSKVGIIDASHFDSQTAYAAVDRHRLDDNHPYIYRTRDGGKHWKLVTSGIPSDQFVNVVREDPKRPGLLYAGTDWQVFVSLDDGEHWQSLQLNLPDASMRDIVFHGDDVIVGTHGRSVWLLDDVTPLRQLSSATAQKSAVLFRPQTACGFQRAGSFGDGITDEGTPFPPEEPQGENAPWGAILDYWIGTTGTPVVLSIYDSSGKRVRRISSADRQPPIDYKAMDIPAYWVHPKPAPSAEPGAHRYIWDLHYADEHGPIVPPGSYTVKMSVGGSAYSQSLTVVRDPRIPATDADLHQQFELALAIGDEVSRVDTLRRRAQEMVKKHPPLKRRLAAVIGSEPKGTPDEGGLAPNDLNSLRSIGGSLRALAGAVESAPMAPSVEFHRAFRALKARATAAAAMLDKVGAGG